MAESGDAAKKRKLESNLNTVRDNLRKIKGLIKLEQFSTQTLAKAAAWASFCFIKIDYCNADRPKRFTDADCATKINIFDDDESKRMVINYGHFFNIELIRKVLDDTGTTLENEVSEKQLIAFRKLANFLDTADETAKILKKQSEKRDLKETAWTVVVGTHLLKALAVNEKMLLESHFTEKLDLCLCGCGAKVNYGDTSMGHEEVWHGCVDILLGPVAVVRRAVTEEEDEGNSAFEMKATRHLDANDVRVQALAKTIVFAFAQKEDLVPTILISKEIVKVFMYEKKHDLLFESTEMHLFDINGNIVVNTVFALWLVINYKYFCTGVRESHLETDFKANFLQCLDENKRDIYQHKIKLGGCQNSRSPFLGYNKSVEGFGQFFID